jgi:ABC-2 type transport system ATP-binding protein
MAAIRVKNLRHVFGDVTALDRLSFEVDDGAFFGFIGPNGAGKTTTINVLTGQLGPSQGSVEVLGVDPVHNPVQVREQIGILPEREDPPSFLTPREYFDFVADVRGIDAVENRAEEWAERLRFRDQLDTMNMDLSKGEKQKVMITQAFLHEPDLVFIDEPMINLDPIIQEELKQFLTDYNGQGNTIFLSTHVLDLAEAVCGSVGIIDNGLLVEQIGMDEMEQETLTEVFLDEVGQDDTVTPDA